MPGFEVVECSSYSNSSDLISRYVLEELLYAAEIMHHSTNLVGNETPGWRSIIHKDIKPGNVYLTNPSDRYFRHYPKIKLADFGMAVDSARVDHNNPRDFSENDGTWGFMAPEQYTWFRKNSGRRDVRPQRTLTEKTVRYMTEEVT